MKRLIGAVKRWVSGWKEADGKVSVIPDHQRKFLYVPIGKNATGTIKNAVALLQGLDPKGEACVGWHKGRNLLRVDLRDARYKDYFKFAFVRNPFRRLVSAYISKLIYRHERHEARMKSRIQEIRDRFQKRDVSFPEFVTFLWEDRANRARWNGHWRPQHFFLTGPDGKLLVNAVGRLENLGEDWKKICAAVGGAVELGHNNKNRTVQKPYREFYDPETLARVADLYREDLDLFGYPRSVD